MPKTPQISPVMETVTVSGHSQRMTRASSWAMRRKRDHSIRRTTVMASRAAAHVSSHRRSR